MQTYIYINNGKKKDYYRLFHFPAFEVTETTEGFMSGFVVK